MRRFPLLRGYKQSSVSTAHEAALDTGRVRRRNEIIEGAFVWPHDPVFRPLIGVYAEGRLKQLGTTYRRAFHERRTWPCCFSFELDEELAERDDLTIAIFETGDVLLAPPRMRRSMRTVEDLIDDARRQASSFSYGGFISFLLLPLNDQIEILCHDLLERRVGAKELAHYRRKVIEGEFSILGVRDDMAQTKEAQELFAELTLQERRGRACLWQGLDHVVDSVIPPPLVRHDTAFDTPPALRSAFEEIVVPGEVRSVLAFNAVGETPDIGGYAQWMMVYQNIVAPVDSRVSRSIDLRARRNVCKRYRLGNLLVSMKLGQTARRLTDGVVQTASGAAGVVLYGPYMSLACGSYTAQFSLRCANATAIAARMQLEIVHGDIAFGRQNIVVSSTSPEMFCVSFTVPSRRAELLGAPKFEFRVTTDGAADVICDSVSLDLCEDPAVGMSAHPATDNWLPFLSVEMAGLREGVETLWALPQSGRVFFGPYCKLLPGRYMLTLDYFLEGAAGGAAELEVVAEPEVTLKHKRFVLMPGTGSEELVFEIAEAESPEDLVGPLEFRLWKADGFEFQCRAVRLGLAGGV